MTHRVHSNKRETRRKRSICENLLIRGTFLAIEIETSSFKHPIYRIYVASVGEVVCIIPVSIVRFPQIFTRAFSFPVHKLSIRPVLARTEGASDPCYAPI